MSDMIKRILLLAALLGVLCAGVVSARSGEDQKEGQKGQEKAAQKDSTQEARVFSLALPFSEGSYLGVFLEEVTAERAKELGLTEERGAVVMKVVQGGPAEKAGVKENDVIVGFNSRRVDSVAELHRLLSETPAGRNVSIEVIRGGAHQTLSATLSKRTNDWTWRPEFDERLRKSTEDAMRRAEQQIQNSEEALKRYGEARALEKGLSALPRDFGNYFFVGPGEFGYFSGGRLGIGVESLTDQLASYFGVKDSKGVLVTQVDDNSPAAKGGLKAGDVITAVDNQPVDSVDALLRAVNKKEEGELSLRVVRDKVEQSVNVTLEKRQRTVRPIVPRHRAALSLSAASTRSV
jgi:serine protease Do